MNTKRICPACGKPLPANPPQQLCPECLIKAGFATGLAPQAGEPTHAMNFIPPAIDEMAGLFPHLEIIELLGQGGMGAVYKARHRALDRLVALKILPPALATGPNFAERFTREARTLARLNHPNIVAVHDFGKAGDFHYFVMEYVDGANLRHIERAGRLPPHEALQIIPQICAALQFAHDEGVIHRDIKPENVLLDKKGRVKIADFGIAKILGKEPDLRLTGAQEIVGTPHYMAPEQVEKPTTVDHRADIYSLGVVFYEMLTGELPLGKFAPPSTKVHVDVRLDEVVLRSLEKEPERRYQQAHVLKTDVETISETEAVPVRSAAKSPYIRFFEMFFGDLISPVAAKTLNISALGFLGSLGFLGVLPGLHWCFGLTGFFGFFGLIGIACAIELIARRRKASRPCAGGATSGWQIGIILVAILISLAGFLEATVLNYPFNAIVYLFVSFVFVVGTIKLAGFWPFPSGLFPQSNFTKRNLRRRGPEMKPKRTTHEDHDSGAPNLRELVSIAIGTIFFFVFFFLTGLLPSSVAPAFLILDLFGLAICALSIAGLWPFESPFCPWPNFSSRNVPDSLRTVPQTVLFGLLRLLVLSIATVALTEIAIEISGNWRESNQERLFIPFAVYAVTMGVWAAWAFFRRPRSSAKFIGGIAAVCVAFLTLFAVSDFYGNYIMPRFVHPELKEAMDISFGRVPARDRTTRSAE